MVRVGETLLPETFKTPRSMVSDGELLYVASHEAAAPELLSVRMLDLKFVNSTALPGEYAELIRVDEGTGDLFVMMQTTPSTVARIHTGAHGQGASGTMTLSGQMTLPGHKTSLTMERDKNHLFILTHSAPGQIIKVAKTDFGLQQVVATDLVLQ